MAPFPSLTKTWHTSSYSTISSTRPELSLSGKTVLITGGSAGIGLAISKAVATAGASTLIIFGRRTEVLAKAQAAVQALSKKTTILTYSVDAANEEQVKDAFSKIEAKLEGKKIDLFIPCAGFFSGPRPIGTETPAEWQSNFNVNILAVYLTVTAFLKLSSPNAVIVNIATAIAHLDPKVTAPWGMVSYAATKLAGAKIMEFVQAENPELRVVNVHPGQVTETEMASKSAKEDIKARGAHIDDAELAADFVVWAASSEATFLKGKLVWVNWDVDQMLERKEEIEKGNLLTLGLEGFSGVQY